MAELQAECDALHIVLERAEKDRAHWRTNYERINLEAGRTLNVLAARADAAQAETASARKMSAMWKAYAKHARAGLRQGAEYWMLWQAEQRDPGSTIRALLDKTDADLENAIDQNELLAGLLSETRAYVVADTGDSNDPLVIRIDAALSSAGKE